MWSQAPGPRPVRFPRDPLIRPGFRLRAQPLRIDVDDERDEEDEAADQDLQERVDLDVIEAVIEDAEDEQPDDRVADAPAPAEQAGAADHHRRDRVEEEGVELVLLGAAEIGDGELFGYSYGDRRDDHHR